MYTKPDTTENRSTFLNVTARRSLNARISVSGNVYYRDIHTDTFNGDINEDSLDQAVYQPNAAEQAALAAAGYTGFPTSGANASNTPFPSWRCIANGLLNDEPAEKCNGLINRSETSQHNGGGFGQLTMRHSFSGGDNQFTAGGGYDRSSAGFVQSTELGYLNPDRSVTGINAFGDGETGGDVDGEPFDTRVDLDGLIQTFSLYATNTVTLSQKWNVTVSGRYNRTTVSESGRDRARRRPDVSRRRPCVQPVQPGGRRDVQPIAHAQFLRRLQRRQPRGDVHRARLRQSRASPASCRTRWRAIRRSTRS